MLVMRFCRLPLRPGQGAHRAFQVPSGWCMWMLHRPTMSGPALPVYVPFRS